MDCLVRGNMAGLFAFNCHFETFAREFFVFRLDF